MYRTFAKCWLPAWLCLICIAPAWAEPQTPGEKLPAQAAKKSKAAKTKAIKKNEALDFIRLRKDKNGKPIALETAIVRYVPQSGQGGLTLDLIGAVHVGDRAYYEKLNKRFEQYDAMLYELVAEKGKIVPKGGRKDGDSFPVQLMKNVLQLESQLEHVDYTKKNFVHADLSPKEIKAAMTKCGEDGLTLTLGILRDMLKEYNRMEQQQAGNPIELPEITLSDLIFPSSGAVKMKRFLAVQLSTQMMEGVGETLNKVLIDDRNQAALKTFQTELVNGKRKMAIFYGAAHMSDMEKHLLADYGLKRDKVEWVTAWDLK